MRKAFLICMSVLLLTTACSFRFNSPVFYNNSNETVMLTGVLHSTDPHGPYPAYADSGCEMVTDTTLLATMSLDELQARADSLNSKGKRLSNYERELNEYRVFLKDDESYQYQDVVHMSKSNDSVYFYTVPVRITVPPHGYVSISDQPAYYSHNKADLRSRFGFLTLHAGGKAYDLFHGKYSTYHKRMMYDRMAIPLQFIPKEKKKMKGHLVICEYQ